MANRHCVVRDLGTKGCQSIYEPVLDTCFENDILKENAWECT